MKRLLLLVLLGAVACGDSTGPDPLPFMLPGEGLVRFTLDESCPTMELAFGINGDVLRGPEILSPGEHQEYAHPAGDFFTEARAIDGSRTFPREPVRIVEGQRVTRVLRC